MSRIPAIDPSTTSGKTRDLLDGVQRMLGGTPNLFAVTAGAPAALDAMVGLFGALARGMLPAKTREAIALAVAQANGCDYCLSAHTVLGTGAGLTPAEIAAARTARSADGKLDALLGLALAIVDRRGRLADADLATARAAGATDAEVLEVVANVALNVFTNYLNLVAATDIDFPVVTAEAA
jgi:uncharacterized peroxidase-related enzyme